MDDIIDQELVALENWGEVLMHPEFKMVTSHLQMKIDTLNRTIEKLSLTPGLDSSVEMMGKVMARKELSSLLSFFEYKLLELREAKLKQALRPQA